LAPQRAKNLNSLLLILLLSSLLGLRPASDVRRGPKRVHKVWNADRGFGFIADDAGGRIIFARVAGRASEHKAKGNTKWPAGRKALSGLSQILRAELIWCLVGRELEQVRRAKTGEAIQRQKLE
jgi:hypothetical protein